MHGSRPTEDVRTWKQCVLRCALTNEPLCVVVSCPEVLPRAYCCRLCGKQCKDKRTFTGYRSERAHHGCLSKARDALAVLRNELRDAHAAYTAPATVVALVAPAVARPPPLTTAPADLAALRSSVPLRDASPALLYEMMGAALFPPTAAMELVARGMRALAEQHGLQQVAEHAPSLRRAQRVIAGGVVQTPLTTLRKLEDEQTAMLEQLELQFHLEVTARYAQLMPGADLSALRFSGSKALVCAPNTGEQMLHWDSTRWAPDNQEVTALLYCTPCDSARLPRFCVHEQLPLELTGATQADHDTRASRGFLLSDDYFHSVPVLPGTLLLFRHAAPHAGTANRTAHNRIALFDMVVPRKDPPPASEQYFSWHYVRDAAGECSAQFADALRANSQHEPLGHEKPAVQKKLLQLLDSNK